MNSTVLMEALLRYEQHTLPRSMRLWVEATLELDPSQPAQPLMPGQAHPPAH
ncbi:hypothetical protein SynNOUM97013_00768 [Synechococcus sp. NOUM97013]|nr:hypothetical protein SynNOUM97013_00768 [Synechococcus sp. NOUM97013]